MAFTDICNQLICLHAVCCHHCSKELCWIMYLQVQGPPGYKSVCCRVRFVKSVCSKHFHLVEDLSHNCKIFSFLLTATVEYISLCSHFSRDLFTHSSTKNIRTSKRVSCKNLCNLHNLLLIHDNSVC